MLRRFFGRGKREPRGNVSPQMWDLAMPIMSWGEGDTLTLQSLLEGVLVTGATGSGKTTGTGRTLALSLLEAGCGGLVLTAKTDERALWEYYCHRTRRSDDLVIFGAQEPWRFNFLDYELNRKGIGAGLTENIVNMFSTVLEVAERSAAGSGGREDEGYWRRACRQLVRNLVDLLALSTGRVSIPDLYRLVISAPTSAAQVSSETWKAESFCFRCLTEADKRSKTPQQRIDFDMSAAYLLREYPNLSEKTRSVIVSTFTSTIDVLNRGLLRTLFCNETNITPDVAAEGKIILIDLAVKEFQDVGVLAQLLWKLAFQRWSERRDLRANARPVFMWADEAQHWVTSQDAMFQTTCRSSRVATILLSQTVSNFEAALGGGPKGKAETAALFGNLNTKVFHASGDPVTNEWASGLIGRNLQTFVDSHSSSAGGDWIPAALGLGHAGETSSGCREAYELEVQPAIFCELRTGGPAHNGMIDALVFQSGRRFKATGRTWRRVLFQQENVARGARGKHGA